MNTWTKEVIAEKIATDDSWLFRGIMAIYARQTEDERIHEVTKYNNGRGFKHCHAKILSSFAKRIKYRGALTEKQTAWARDMMKCYAGQLTKIANGKL